MSVMVVAVKRKENGIFQLQFIVQLITIFKAIIHNENVITPYTGSDF